MGIYGQIAPWYDRLFPVSGTQAAFLVERLNKAMARRVLDAGCGTGRHLEILADDGFEVLGLEPEPEMAEAARRRLHGRGEVVTAGLDAAPSDRPFDAALCLGNTLAHLRDDAGLRSGLRALARALRPGGLLIAQTVNFEKALREGRVEFRDREIEGGYRFRRRYDFEDAPRRIGFHLEFSGPSLRLAETLDLRPWTLEDLRAAFLGAGLRIIESSGDWDGSPRGPDSPATILSALRD